MAIMAIMAIMTNFAACLWPKPAEPTYDTDAADAEPYNPCGAASESSPPADLPRYDYSSGLWFNNPAGASCIDDQWVIRASVYSAEAIDADTIALQVWDSLTGALLSEHDMTPPAEGETDWLLSLDPEDLEFRLGCSTDPLPDAMWAYLLFPLTGEAAGPFFMPRDDEYDSWGTTIDYAAMGYTSLEGFDPTIAMSACKDGALLGTYTF